MINPDLCDDEQEIVELVSQADPAQLRIFAIGEECDTYFFAPIRAKFPIVGTQIDWSQVSRSISDDEFERAGELLTFPQFYDRMVEAHGIGGTIRYAGDGITDLLLEGTVEGFRAILEPLIDISQHHYFSDRECTWVLCCMFGGDMYFGYAPQKGL